MLETIALDDFARKKLSMFHQLLELDDGIYSTRHFKQFTELSYARLVSLFAEMNDDLNQQSNIALLTDEGKIMIEKEALIQISYEQYLFQKSIAYKFLFASLFEKNYRLEDFCEKNFISRASALRKLQPLISYIKKFDININCSKMKITGNEATIRILYFNFFWLTSFGEDFFTVLNEERRGLELFDSEDKQWMTYVEPRQWFLLISINRLRIEKGFYLGVTPFDQLIYPETNFSFLEELRVRGVTEKHRLRERDFLSYMLFYWNPFLHANDPRLTYVKSYMLDKHHPLGELINQFQTFYMGFLDGITLSEEESDLLHANIFTTFLNHASREASLPLSVDFSYELFKRNHPLFDPLYEKIQDYLVKASQKSQYIWINNCLDHLVYSCTLFLLPFYEKSKNNHQLHVGVILFQNAMVSQSLSRFLAKIPFVQAELITSSAKEEYDFYIATSPLLLSKNTRRKGNFKLIALNEMENYQAILLSSLLEKYEEKVNTFMAG
ncbi:helix-turn-helix domain-containing protein [Enterococcus sp. BWT-B8]|uniref:helix-turn-helix domain-containing protein n=1 Tax=Enterococcus sp. BWT-B8 TaxID=2885157 RepID=UPI001E568B9B|nr:helix-turn-helix domain-containing protein [Enterococcus sp. BWT-B8]MCB5951555.1 helix-turn-helix domain-containing protein [Enterococcus sp. BWT-B8]